MAKKDSAIVLLRAARQSLAGGLETPGGDLEAPGSVADRKLVARIDAYLKTTQAGRVRNGA